MQNLLAVLLLLLGCGSATAQGWPSKPVRLVVPTAAGGPVDQVARLAAQKMSEAIGQPVLVENRAGANGILAAEAVVHSAPDGQTLLVGNSTTHGTNPFLIRKLPYDPIADFTAVAGGANALECLVIHPSVPASTVQELIAYARANPGRLSYGSSGTGSAYHLAGELFGSLANVQLVHVPYKGLAPVIQELLGGQTQLAFTSLSGALPNVRSGKLRLLAMVENKRYAGLPDVPALPETLPGYAKPATWIGFFGPAAMQAALTARINGEFVKALSAPDVRTKLDGTGLEPMSLSPEQFGDLVRRDLDAYAKLIKQAGLQPE
jgi:tripartite-type tricarboxylate transporter receptor subunit TctC